MSQLKYGSKLALREHLFSGNPANQLDSLLIFGVQHLSREIARLRAEGEVIKSRRIPYIKAVRQINNYVAFAPPKDLPIEQIMLTEYWISK
tara:strand:+ start:7369 stop:7641 length:273 start_codon:yes stop_codon:yes gene_type:complete